WKDYIAPALLSYLRGSIWLEAGEPDVATVFYRDASGRDPVNAKYRAFYMHALAESDPDLAEKLARQVLADDEKHAPVVIVRAADIRFKASRTASDAESAKLYRELVP